MEEKKINTYTNTARYMQIHNRRQRANIHQFRENTKMYCYYISDHLRLWLAVLEQLRWIQPPRWRDWVWRTGNKATHLLEHLLLQNMSRNEDRPTARVHCHQQASWLSALTDCWWPIPRHLTGSWEVERVDWFPRLITEKVQQRRVQCRLY